MAIVPSTPLALKDGTPCVLRSTEEADAPALLELDEENAREYAYTIYAPDEVAPDLEVRRRKVREFRDRSNWLLLMALCAGAPVGAVSFRGGITRRTRHQGTLGISVAGRWRRRGVGQLLMNAVLEWGASHPLIEKVSLVVFSGNAPAIALYRSLGFVEEGRRVREIRMAPGLYEDDVVMARFVKSPGSAGAKNRQNLS